jgi:hypothetical protein
VLLELFSIAQQKKSRGEAYVTWTSLKVKPNITAPELLNLEEKKDKNRKKKRLLLFYFIFKSKVSSFWIYHWVIYDFLFFFFIFFLSQSKARTRLFK